MSYQDNIDQQVRMDPKGTLHRMNRDGARHYLTNWYGMALCSTYGHALRHVTPRDTLPEGDSQEAMYTRRTQLIPDASLPQLRLELDRSALAAVVVPSPVYYGYASCAGWEGLAAAAGWTLTSPGNPVCRCSVIEHADREYVTMLFRRPQGAGCVRRKLEFDVSIAGFERIRPSHDQSNLVPLPHDGALERWISLPGGEPPALPVELESMLMADATVSDADVAAWIERHYRKSKGSEKGHTREEIYQALLAANQWVPADYDIHSLSRAAQLVSFFDSKRGAGGIKWLLERREDVQLESLRGVSVETLDPSELAAFRQWRATLEMHPTRRKQRAEQAAENKRRLEERAALLARFGSEETRAMLSERQGVNTYFMVHEQRETKRRQACEAMAIDFVALPLSASTPQWWAESGGPGTPHDQRYQAIVARFANGREVAA